MGILPIIKYRNFVVLAATVTISIGCMVIIGWIFDSRVLKSLHPSLVSMKFNSALCFVLLGLSLLLYNNSINRSVFLPKLLAIIVSVFGFSSLLQLSGYEILVDELFIDDIAASSRQEQHPGRIPYITSICFMFGGIAMLFIGSAKKPLIIVTQYLLHSITLISFIALLGYIFNAPALYSYTFPNSMALHSAVIFILFSTGASLANPHQGVTALFTGKLIGNIMARKLFIGILPAVLIICYIRMLFHRNNILSIEVGMVLLSIAFLLISLISVWVTAQALNKIAEKEKLFEDNIRMGIDAAPYALILSDNESKIIHVNFQAERMFKYCREELMGLDCKIILPEEIMTHLNELRKEFYRSPRVITYKLEDNMHCHRKDGSRFPAEIVISPVITSQGPFALTSVIDLTARVENERLAQIQLEELQHKNQEMEQFNYIASHDLQEPLRTVANYIMLLQEDYPDNITPEINGHLVVMDQAVSRMSKLIRNLLDFGRLGRNKKLVFTDCDTVVKEVTADLNNLISYTSASIILNDELPKLYAYDTELRQLFQNLINNAIKFRKEGTEPRIQIGCRAIEGFYEIYVSDNGIGIDEKHFDTIFHIFQRLNHDDEYEGYGVGLANCKKIAEMHGGKIWVESEYGKGSTFKFTLIHFKL